MKKILLFVLVIAISSCEDDDNTIVQQIGSTVARVHYSGAIAADGCGWMVELDPEGYKPVNLPEIYEDDGLFIVSEFEILSEREACGLSPNGPRQINIKKLPNNNTVEIFWDETQCADPWYPEEDGDPEAATAKALVQYLDENNIEVFSVDFVDYADDRAFCTACSCLKGRRIYVRIAAEDLNKADLLGFVTGVCVEKDPMENISWLKELKGQILASAQPAGSKIVQYQYNGECVFLVDLCYQCADDLQTVYNSEKEKICEFGGIIGLNTCEDFFDEATGELVLWSNVTPEGVLGKWHMAGFECCMLSNETFGKDQIVWEFLSDGTVKVNININLPDDSQLPITSDGSFNYEVEDKQLELEGVSYKYHFEAGKLILSDSPESDGPIIEFVK